jgi:large repetitive protein
VASGIAVSGPAGVGPLMLSDLSIANSAGAGLAVTGGGTVTATGDNDLTTSGGAALVVEGTAIGAGNLTFRSISSTGGPGIRLASTGGLGRLFVTGSGNATVGGDNSGGTIQNSATIGVGLFDTLGPSLRNMRITSTGSDGIRVGRVTDFAFRNGRIDQSGTSVGAIDAANISLGVGVAGPEPGVSGSVVIADNVLTNARYHGVDLRSFAGTVSSLSITGNTITSGTTTGPGGASFGSGIQVWARGTTTSVASVTTGTIANNVITNFPAGAGISVQGGNANPTGPAGTMGTPGTTNVIAITGNRLAGEAGGLGQGMGTHAIQALVDGVGQGNFEIADNGTSAAPITNIEGNVISVSAIGAVTVTASIAGNVIVANHQAGFGGPLGISVGAAATPGVGDTALLTTTIQGNTVSGTDGNGIIAAAREGSTSLIARILDNVVAAPLSGVRPGIRVESGGIGATNTTVCLAIAGNASDGSGDATQAAPGIGLRKEGTATTTHAFGVVGLTPSPAGSPAVENVVNELNPGSQPGVNFGVGGTALISATSGFTACTIP